MKGMWFPNCDWLHCGKKATRYLQLGYRDQDETTMFVCERHYGLGVSRLNATRGRGMPLGSVLLVDSIRVEG